MIKLSDSILPETPEAFSLFGEPLFRAPLRPETLEKQEALYAKALKGYKENPDDPVGIEASTATDGRPSDKGPAGGVPAESTPAHSRTGSDNQDHLRWMVSPLLGAETAGLGLSIVF